MNRPRWRKVWADLAGHKTRTLLVVLSIAVGVFAVGTVGASYLVLSRTFSAGYLAANPAHATLTMAPFDAEVVDVVRRLPGVAEAEGRRTVGGLRLQIGPDAWMNIALTAIPDFRAIRIFQLRPEQGRVAPGLHGLLLERTSLPFTHARVGDRLTIELPDGRRRRFTLDGTVYNAATPPPSFTNVLEGYIGLDTLEWLGEARTYNQLNLTVAENPLDQKHIEAVARQVAEKVEKGGYSVFFTSVPVPGQHPAYQVIQSLILLLGGMGLFSLFLSGFLVINTLNGLLAQHIRQIGMMKAVGARSGQLVRMYLVLVLGFGALAFLVAAPLATAAAYGLCTTFAGWINFDLIGFEMPPAVAAVMAGISLVVPVLAALLPVQSGTRLTVREAISSYGLGRGQFGKGRLDRVLEHVRAFSRPVLISIRNTFRRKTRLLLTLITLTLAGAVFIAVFNVRTSLTWAINSFLDSFLSDLNLSFTGGPQQIDKVRQVARGVPGVAEVEGWVAAAGKLLDEDDRAIENFTVIGVPAGSRMIRPIIEQGRWLQPGDQAAVVVGTDFLARYPDTQPGSVLRLTLDERRVTLTVVGVMRFLGAGGGSYITYGSYDYIARLTSAGGSAGEYRLTLTQSDPQSQQRAARALVEAFKARGIRATVQTGAEVKAQVSTAINIIIAFLAPMAVMVGLVGALGLMGTMSLNVIERTREIGVLRAVGAANGKVFQIVVVEGLMIGLLSWALGILMSLPISAALAAIVGSIFQVELEVAVSLEGFAIWLAVVLVLAWLASLLPAWSAVRLTVRDVLAYE
jgi:putative ABC transport system permease protein